MTRKFDLYKNGEYLGNYTLAKISKKIAEGQSTVREAAISGTPIRDYMIVPAQTAENERVKRELLKEWDEIRFRLKPSLRKQEIN